MYIKIGSPKLLLLTYGSEATCSFSGSVRGTDSAKVERSELHLLLTETFQVFKEAIQGFDVLVIGVLGLDLDVILTSVCTVGAHIDQVLQRL